jgi:hypothetical protein
MTIIGQVTTTNWSSDAVKVAMVVAGCLVLYIASKVGLFVLKILFGLASFALLGGAIWWFFFRG